MEETLQLILQKLESLEQGQKSLEQGQRGLEQGQKSLEQGQRSLEQGQKSLEQGQKSLEQGQKSLEQGQRSLEVKLDNFGTEMRSNFKHVEEKLDEHKRVFDVVTSEIKGLKDDVDYVNGKVAKHDMDLNRIIKQLQS